MTNKGLQTPLLSCILPYQSAGECCCQVQFQLTTLETSLFVLKEEILQQLAVGTSNLHNYMAYKQTDENISGGGQAIKIKCSRT